jgi:hypothetical protein
VARGSKKTGTASHPGPQWTEEQIEAADQNRQAWEKYFSTPEPVKTKKVPFKLTSEEAVKLAKIRARYEAELLRYPNVVAVGEGIQTKGGKPTGQPCIVVFVVRKIPQDQLAEDEILPEEVEGVPVDVVEAGGIVAL